ncbi:hypothetical protein [Pseudomonas sp. UBA7530]|uniref:hypothetical protein n=1 Tax=Pseudomonas sp. UBA7530 TaxID=1947341 RepID=UPI002600C7A6|nr:hypothetical protein [Pseudomonas sp. UBA7530]
MTSTPETPPLTVEDALHLLTEHINGPRMAVAPLSLAVRVFRPGSIGGTPVSRIVSMQAGFDWDSRLMLLTPEHPLTTLSSDDVAAIRTSASKGQSWHAYQAYKKNAEKIKKLELKVVALTGERAHLLDAVSLRWTAGPAEGSQELRIGSNLAGGIRGCPDGTFEAKCTLHGSTLEMTGLPSAEMARAKLENIAGQWLKQLLA